MKTSFICLVAFSVLALIIIPTTNAFSQSTLTGAPILRITPDPISTGRGFTGVSQTGGVSSIYWNPAGLAFQKGGDIALSRFNWASGSKNNFSYNYIMGDLYIEGVGTLAGEITYLSLGKDQFINRNQHIGSEFSSHEFSIGISLGRLAIPKTLSLGIGIKYISSKLIPSGLTIDGKTSQIGRAVTFDIGALYYPGNFHIGNKVVRPSIGLSLTNFGGRLTYLKGGYDTPLPTVLRLGASGKIFLDKYGINVLIPSIQFSKIMVRVDSTGPDGAFEALISSWGPYQYFNGRKNIDVSLVQQIMFGAGFAYWYSNTVGFRLGYYNEGKANGGRKFLTFGASLKYSLLQLNASYIISKSGFNDGNSFRIGLLINL